VNVLTLAWRAGTRLRWGSPHAGIHGENPDRRDRPGQHVKPILVEDAGKRQHHDDPAASAQSSPTRKSAQKARKLCTKAITRPDFLLDREPS